MLNLTTATLRSEFDYKINFNVNDFDKDNSGKFQFILQNYNNDLIHCTNMLRFLE